MFGQGRVLSMMLYMITLYLLIHYLAGAEEFIDIAIHNFLIFSLRKKFDIDTDSNGTIYHISAVLYKMIWREEIEYYL